MTKFVYTKTKSEGGFEEREMGWGGEGNGGEGGEWGRGMMEREGSEGRKGSCGREDSWRRVKEVGKMWCAKFYLSPNITIPTVFGI